MPHPDPLRLQAYFDGELDPMAAVEVEEHVQRCGDCGAQLQSLGALRADLRNEMPNDVMPVALRARLDELLNRESGTTPEIRATTAARFAPRGGAAARSRPAWLTWPFWLGSLSGGAAVTTVAVALFLAGWLPRAQPLQAELVDAHVRSMMSGHAIDVVSSDHHTVKPWFGGHADVSPVVADFDAQGFRLIGGRADYLDHQRAAVMVYQHGAHTIDVFSWASGSGTLPASSTTRDGYHVVCWRARDLNYCAISDTGRDELHALQDLLQALSSADAP